MLLTMSSTFEALPSTAMITKAGVFRRIADEPLAAFGRVSILMDKKAGPSVGLYDGGCVQTSQVPTQREYEW